MLSMLDAVLLEKDAKLLTSRNEQQTNVKKKINFFMFSYALVES